MKLVLILVALVAPAALAAHTPIGRCDSADAAALGIVEITSGIAEGTVYVDDRNVALGNGLWIYHEGNGIWTARGAGVYADDVAAHNLQRGGYSSMAPGPLDPVSSGREICADSGDVMPDWLLFNL